MLHQLKTYIRFLKNSSNQHGVHSPFVYELLTKCLYSKSTPAHFKKLEQHRNWLQNNNTEIKVTDFGAGSRVFTSNLRKVSAIAKTAGMTKKRQRLLSKIVAYLKPKEILEIGTSVGLATAAIWVGNPEAHITTVEGCPETSSVARAGFEQFSFSKMDQVTMKFEQFFDSEIFSPQGKQTGQKTKEIDLAFIDGNHSKEATLAYFEKLLPVMRNAGVIIFDDIYWSDEMTAAWREICSNKQVTVSIDTYQWGMVFFRKEQQKEHFILRV